MDFCGTLSRIMRGDETQLAAPACHVEMLFLVPRFDAAHIGLDPDLQKVHDIVFGVIEFAVAYAGTSAHALHITRANHRAVAHAVLVLECALENITDDFHVLMPMRTEAH